MDIIHNIASVTKAISDAGQHELYQQLEDISKQAYELTLENLQLKEELRVIKDKINDEASRTVKGEAYYFGDDGPFCTKCYDDEGKKIRMTNDDNGWGKEYNLCPKCKNRFLVRSNNVDLPKTSTKVSFD